MPDEAVAKGLPSLWLGADLGRTPRQNPPRWPHKPAPRSTRCRASHVAALAIALWLSAMTVTACATQSQRALPPDFAARVTARISAAADQPTQTLRYNPIPCNCPAFEVQLEGHWHRVAFDAPADSPLMLALKAATEQDDAQQRRFSLSGSFGSDLDTCAKGVIFVSFSPAGWADRPE